MRSIRYAGTISSKIGFYIGDICYALSDKMYHELWGEKHDYNDGQFEAYDSGCCFAVAQTAYGDGSYVDQDGHDYPVDAGVIGIVPLELVAKEKAKNLGSIFVDPGMAIYDIRDGVFDFTMPNGDHVHIDTTGEDTFEWDDEDYEDDDDDWEDDEDE